MEKKQKTKKTLTFRFNETIMKRLEELNEKNGHDTFVETVKQCIIFMHDNTFNTYTALQKQKIDLKRTQVENPDYLTDPIDRKIANAEATKERKLEREREAKKQICERLRGTLEEDGIDFVCNYSKYTYLNANNVSSSKQSIPLNLLHDKLVENQFLKPSGISEEEVIEREALLNL